ncbi:MAG: BON domain-containing protein [Rhodomicrobium sp.]
MTKTGPEKDHTAIEAKIRAALHSEPRLGPSFHLKQIIFEDDGSLVLDGEVPNVAAKKLALERTAAIPGITGIVDRLHVIPATPMGDGEIRVHVRDALINEPAFENLEVRSSMLANGCSLAAFPKEVRAPSMLRSRTGLNGRVPGLPSKRLAGVLAWWVPGVRDVVNGIELDPPGGIETWMW